MGRMFASGPGSQSAFTNTTILESAANRLLNIGETSVSKYMPRRRNSSSQTWRTFLENHVQDLVSIDFFTVPTIRFQILYVFMVLAHHRRRVVHFAVDRASDC